MSGFEKFVGDAVRLSDADLERALTALAVIQLTRENGTAISIEATGDEEIGPVTIVIGRGPMAAALMKAFDAYTEQHPGAMRITMRDDDKERFDDGIKK